jgi:glycosyltransferase involved in cell wall biosynthesis
MISFPDIFYKPAVKIIFIGINGYQIPYTRVRCYHFAQVLRTYGVETEVFSYQEHLSPQRNAIQILQLNDKEKVSLNLKAFCRLFNEKNSIFYIQKVHYHAAAPFLLSRLGRNRFFLDYDDWDIDRSPLFEKSCLNRLFFGCDGTSDITGTLASKALGCVASSKHLYDFLYSYNKNTSYIPTGVDIQHFSSCPDRTQGKVTFIWTGQVWGEIIYKNILYLLDCFSEVCRQYSTIHLKIIGDGAWMPKIRNYVGEKYPRLNIELIGWVAPQQMPEYLSDADVGLLPLIPDVKNDLWMRSKSPTKLFEYMAMGLPTIASDMGEVKSIIENGTDGFLVRNREEFIEKMELLIRNRELRIKMGEASREKAKKEYSLEVLGKRLFTFVSNCSRQMSNPP